jgi:hypothetical protein
MNELFWRLATLVPFRLPRWFHNNIYLFFFAYVVVWMWISNDHFSFSWGPWWPLGATVTVIFMMAFLEISLLELFFYACLGLLSGLEIVLIAVLGNTFAPFLLNMPGELISLVLIMASWFIGVYLSVADSRFDGAKARYHAAQVKYHPATAKRQFSGLSYPETEEAAVVDEKEPIKKAKKKAGGPKKS